MFNTRMTSGSFGSFVAQLRRIEGFSVVQWRPRHDQIDVLGADAMQRFGSPTA